MNRIKLSNIDIELFRNSFTNFKRCVMSDFEFDYDNLELLTNSKDFDKWHLVTLASFYGGDLFGKNHEIIINDFQLTDLTFKIDFNVPKIKLITQWNDKIEINPAVLHSADFFLTNKLENKLSKKSKLFIKEKMPLLDFNQSVFQSPHQYAYFISDNTLVFILTERENAKITHLFKVAWNEI